uniref:PGG domain-containing protein n=1 Tax=Fagus sylvatica TaxID=28930 RepID=A0A2N9GMH9_FAGSY
MASTIDQINPDPEMENVKKYLFKIAMQGKWEKVVEIYRTNPMAHKAKLTRSGDTALHIAVSDGQEERVEELCIANVDKSLVGARNHDNETPFFLAALYGKKEAFLCLHELCGTENGYNYCRRKDGDTILHCAISGDYFDLAFRIIRLYEDLVNSFNYHGLTPLHILASKPSSFRSGSHFGGWYILDFRIGGKLLVDPLDSMLPMELGIKVFPVNYGTCFEFVKLASKSMLVIFGLGSSGIRKIEEKKQKHTWAVQILNELLQYSSLYEYDYTGANPLPATPQDDVGTIPYDVSDGGDINFASEASFLGDLKPKTPTADTLETKEEEKNIGTGGNDKTKEAKKKKPEKAKKESPILIAAKNGITEIVEEIPGLFPVAIHDMNEHKKNIVLLAVENRQPHVYQLLLRRNVLRESVFRRVDHKGNSALHLSAKLGDHKPWLIPGAALQIQWEIKWHEPWPLQASTTVPGGIKEESGTPTLENQPAFDIFAIASLVALCFSVTALVMFLSILTSRYQERDFGMDLPRKLLLGLTSLFVSIASMLISFCAGHFFVLKDKLKYAAFPVYAVTCLPITFFAIAQFPLYFDLLWAIFKKVPQRSYKVATF